MDVLILLAGIVFAAIGGELFVRGIVGIALWARISTGIIAATFAAFATSSPELSVSVTSALAGTPQIALGDALGSNIVNIGLILGIALLMTPIKTKTDVMSRDYYVALAAPLVIVTLAKDGELSRLDGLLLLTMFLAWLTIVIMEARVQRSLAPKILGETKHQRSLVESLIGLVCLIISGKLIVLGASAIATQYGVDAFVMGATIVAVGTSAPELATVLIARLRGHDEIGLGTVLGSNVFNSLFIVAVAALIAPIAINWYAVSTALLFGLLSTILVLPGKTGLIGRPRGILVLASYMLYMTLLITGQQTLPP